MLNAALKFLKTIEDNGYEAYIVGGFVRDYILGIESNDIDVCTNAKPSDIRKIFVDNCLPNQEYGSVVVVINNTRFEVTTFRREITYEDNRKPVEFEYIDSLTEDLQRRDFTINAICMNKDKQIIDILNGKKDITNREINTIGDSVHKLSEDSLRILRAVRFATVLNFKLSSDVKQAIKRCKHLLSNLSYERKKAELDKIFGSIHVKYGVKLLIELGLDEELKLYKLKDINYFDDIMGIWALLDVDDIYPFTKNEKNMMQGIRDALKEDNIDTLVLYKYGLYINSIAASIKGLDKKQLAYKYENLPIKELNEIKITGDEIMNLLNMEPGRYIKNIFDDLENSILLGRLDNDTDKIKEYLLNKYGTVL